MLWRHVVIGLLSAVGTTYLIRSLGPAAWGGFAIAYLLLFSVDTMVTRGVLVGLLLKEEPAGPPEIAAAARIALTWGLGSAAMLGVLAMLVPQWYAPPHITLLVASSAVCCVLYALRSLPLVLLERGLRYRPVAAAEIADMVGFYAIATGGVLLGHPFEGLALATVARGVISLAILRVAHPSPLFGRSNAQVSRRLISLGAPLCLVVVVSGIDGLIPSVIIGSYERDVGYIATAATVLGYALALVNAINRVAVPGFARLTGAERASATRRAASMSTVLTLCLVVPLAGLAKFWMPALLGDEWRDGVVYMQLVAAGLAVAACIGVLNAVIMAGGATRSILRLQLITILTYLILAVVLVAIVGVIGVAIAYMLSRWVTALAHVRTAQHKLGIGLDRDSLKATGLGLAAMAALAVAAEQGPVWALVGSVAFGATWLITFSEELATLRRAARRVPLAP